MVNVIVIDDHPIIMDGLKNLFDSHADIHPTGFFSNGHSVLEQLGEIDVDVALLDINLPDVNGINLCKEIKEKHPEIAIVALSLHNERPVIRSMIKNGAKGYVLKNAPGEEIIEAIHRVYNGHTYYCSATQQVMADADAAHLDTVPLITRREREVLQHIGKGLTTQEVADKLFISTHTVESHRKKLMEKFEVKNIISVIKLATEYGLL
ncbi:response regulator [Parapedobacter tibetensis]|uniref:response regulator n=1 Tax=Parapedobacter tibetensis TaxID=2972951 RepID=UPI00214D574F|nr:response regulator transcription factor [Parapedobacter tibetensis]